MKNEFKLPRLRPLDLSREIYAPHRKLYGFALRVKNKPGVLFRITKVLAELRINILGFSASTLRPEAEEAVIVLLTDCGRIIKPCDKVLKDLRSLEGVIDAEGIEPNKFGALFDVVHFPLQVHGERGVIFCEPILRGMIEVMRRQIGPGMNAILWKAGYYGGAEVAKEFEERYKLKSPEDQFEMLKFKAVALGWFIITDISISKKPLKVVLKLFNPWECSLARERRKEPQSHFIRGILSGFSSYIFKREMLAVEKRCMAMGDSYCEFIVTAREEKAR